MNSSDHPKQTAAAVTPRNAVAPSIDLPALTDMPGPSLAQRFESAAVRSTSAELGYGCVDWFIYGADTRSTPAPLRS